MSEYIADRINFQIIRTPAGEELAVLPLEELEEMLDILEAEDIRRKLEAGEEEAIPAEVAYRIVFDGESPLKVFREYRGLTQEQLAEKAGTTKNYISQIENRRRHAGRKLLKRLAQALNLSPEDLADERAD